MCQTYLSWCLAHLFADFLHVDASDIIYVIEGGFVWEGGLREGYEIISVNGIPIDSLGYFGIYELLADTSINEYQFLVVTNDGDTEEITLSIPS